MEGDVLKKCSASNPYPISVRKNLKISEIHEYSWDNVVILGSMEIVEMSL